MASSTNTPPHLPLHEGPFVPGCLDVMSGFGEESVFTRLWYPTSLNDIKEQSSRWPLWMDERYGKGFATVLGIWPILLKIVRKYYSGEIYVPAVMGADVIEKMQSKQFPVIVFSHGLGACRFFYSMLCLQLASHGFVVAAVEHRDESAATTFFYESEKKYSEDKMCSMQFRRVDENVGGSHLVIRKRQLKIRAGECSRALDFLMSLNEGKKVNNLLDRENKYKVLEQLQGRLDFSTTTMMGHSFGGATALLTPTQDDRFKQLLVLDSWLFGLKNENEMPAQLAKIPKLFLNTDYFQMPNNLDVMRRFVQPADAKFTVKCTTHEHQCDTPQVVGMWLNMRKPKLDAALGMRINLHLILRYLRERVGDSVIWDNSTFLDENIQHIVDDISLKETTQTAKL